MPFIEQEASLRYEEINGKRVPIITPQSEVTLTNTVTGKEYMSDAEAQADVDSAVTDTKQEDISRNVNVIVGPHAFGSKTNI